jgi:hypothetical protein
MRTAEQALEAIKQLHAPDYPPEGFRWTDGSTEPICGGCATGDPYLDPRWPCETRKIADDVKSHVYSNWPRRKGW